MKELKSGFYLIKNNKVIPKEFKEIKDLKSNSLRLISKDFKRIELKNFNNCLLWCSNTPINLDIEITQLSKVF